MERRITVGVDGSPGGRRALTWAIQHAAGTGATVDIVTAYEPEPLSYDADGTNGCDLSREFAADRQQLDLSEVLARIPGPRPAIAQRMIAGHAVDVLIEPPGTLTCWCWAATAAVSSPPRCSDRSAKPAYAEARPRS